MTVLDINPLVMKNVELLIGSDTPDDFRKHVEQVIFTPTSSSTSWTGLGKNTHTDSSTATWVLALTYAQDWKSAKSLSNYLFDHEGETIPCEFRPLDGGPSFTADVVITPGAIGGNVNAFATTTVNLGVTGKPVRVPATP